jgi:predicted O-linked N-acetylglucosamine transferase (SPINDLY family)
VGQPRTTEAFFYKFVAKHQQGDLRGAEKGYRKILRHAPRNVATLINLGILLKGRGELKQAEELFLKAVELAPEHADGHTNLGGLFARQGKKYRAISCYRTALDLDPESTNALTNLGIALRIIGQYVEAFELLSRANEMDPNRAKAHEELAAVYREWGVVGKARAHLQRALDIDPENAVLRLKLATLLPVIAESTQQILEYRQHFATEISNLTKEHISIENPAWDIERTNFYLAYHGMDDRPLQESVARLYQNSCPALNFIAPHCRTPLSATIERPIRLGLISRYFRDHAIGWTFGRALAAYPKNRFRTILYTFEGDLDEVWREMSKQADKAIVLPEINLAACQKAIAADKLDVLIYADIGMEPTSYFLAMSRLAHVQCVAGGHPVTSGIPNLDYWIGNDLGEPDGAEAHYSEKLLRLKGISNNYQRARLQQPAKTRADLGLPDAALLYTCPQSLFKFHPDFDQILGRVLRRAPEAKFVLFEGPHAAWGKLLMERFARSIPDVVAQVHMAPRLPLNDFINALALSDIVLDTVHFGGGNTSFQALALGIPIVTLEGDYARGRVTSFLYRQIGVMDCVAGTIDEYVEIALRLGRDRRARAEVSQAILAGNDVLFDNDSGSLELADFFLGLFGQTIDNDLTPAAG